MNQYKHDFSKISTEILKWLGSMEVTMTDNYFFVEVDLSQRFYMARPIAGQREKHLEAMFKALQSRK
jgi:hypothetical protein